MDAEFCMCARENSGLAARLWCDPVHLQSRATYGTVISCTAVNDLQNNLLFKARANSACLTST